MQSLKAMPLIIIFICDIFLYVAAWAIPLGKDGCTRYTKYTKYARCIKYTKYTKHYKDVI